MLLLFIIRTGIGGVRLECLFQAFVFLKSLKRNVAFNDQLQNNLPNQWTVGELNGHLKNNSPNLFMDAELNGHLENSLPNGWAHGELNGSLGKTCQRNGRTES